MGKGKRSRIFESRNALKRSECARKVFCRAILFEGFSANFRAPKVNPELVCKPHAILHAYHEALPKVTSKLPPKLSFSSVIKIFFKVHPFQLHKVYATRKISHFTGLE